MTTASMSVRSKISVGSVCTLRFRPTVNNLKGE
jgi:hypothetical protein